MDHVWGREVSASERAIYSLLQTCTDVKDLAAGRQTHSLMVQSGLDSVAILGDRLIRLFAFYGSLLEANLVFCRVVKASVYTWYAIIAAQAAHEEINIVLELYHKMRQVGTKPNRFIFPCVLKACGRLCSLEHGKLIHDEIIRVGSMSNLVVGNSLVDMYAKCGSITEARKVFDKLSNRTVVSWSAIIAGYAKFGDGHVALELFNKMQQEGIKPNKVVFLCTLKACGSVGASKQGKLIHDKILKDGMEPDVVVGSTLINMYAKCGEVEEARKVFDNLLAQNAVPWGLMISAYAQYGYNASAFELFGKMHTEGIKPDTVLFLSILKAIVDIGLGMLMHDQIVRNGFDSDRVVGSILISMYAKFGGLEDASLVFDNLLNPDVVSWSALIAGYAEHGHGLCALETFRKMQEEGLKPDKLTFWCSLKACASIGALEQGNLIHGQIVNDKLESDVLLGSTLIDMYVRCGSLDEARKVFDELPNRGVVAWCAMIEGYAQHEYDHHALDLFARMHQEGIKPDKYMLSCLLKICGNLGTLKQGKLLHHQMKTSSGSDMIVGNTLIDMYAKCGSLEEAQNVFDRFINRDVVSWGTIIAGYAYNGNCRLAKQCLEEMQQHGMKPNHMIYSTLLSGCSHAGQVEEGIRYFTLMTEEPGFKTSIKHFNCMIDLLSRAGFLNDARHLLQTMPIIPDLPGWLSLLTSCATYGNVELGRQCFDRIVQFDPSTAIVYVIMSNIYANASMWENVNEIQDLRKFSCKWKKPGRAWTELNISVHELIVEDKRHPQSEKIYEIIYKSLRLIKREGYVPQLELLSESVFGKEMGDAFSETSQSPCVK